MALESRQLVGGQVPAGPERDAALSDLRLTDGGNYDNMAIEPVWKQHEVVLASDAGGTFDFSSDKNLIWRIQRYQAIQENQSRALRKRWLISSFETGVMSGTYWGVANAATSYDAQSTVGYSKALARDVIAEIRTDLDGFSEAEAKVLENHAYLLADIAIQKHAPQLVPAGAPTAVPPHQEWMPPQRSEAQIRTDLADSGKRKLLGRW